MNEILQGARRAGAVVAVLAAGFLPAAAKTLGEMAEEAEESVDGIGALMSGAFWIVGAAIVGLGLLKVKKHVEQPQQTTLGAGVIALVVGAALIATPAVIDVILGTFDLDPGASVARPKLN